MLPRPLPSLSEPPCRTCPIAARTQPPRLSRRRWLWQAGGGLGGIALAHLLADEGLLASDAPPASAQPGVSSADLRGALNGGLSVADGKLVLRSPYFDKRGSSPSATGYFAVAGGADQRFTFRPIAIDPAADDGKTIDPRELVELPAKR